MAVEERSLVLGELDVATIRSAEEMVRMAPEWETLWESCPNATPFQHPAWAGAWWKNFGADKELVIILLRDNGQLVGVVPLCILAEKGERKCMFLGTGLSDSLDLLVKNEFRSILVRTTFEVLEAEDWKVCDLQPLPPSCWLLAGARSLRRQYSIEALQPNTILNLPGSWEEFQGRYSAHFKERIRDATRKLAACGEVCFHQAHGCGMDGVLNVLLEFRHKAWEQHLGEQEWNQLKGFFLDALAGCKMHCELRMYTLRVNREIAAGLCGFVLRNRAYLYLMGFDEKYAQASPGRVLMWQCLRALIEEGVTICDFLRGKEEYKYRWGVVEMPQYALRIHRGEE